jgi:phage terminase large subunit
MAGRFKHGSRLYLSNQKAAIAEFPHKLQFLFKPKRYKVAYGGRGGSKSWGFARALLLIASMKPTRILCCREIQKSIKDSVHKLLKDQVSALGLDGFYTITETSIKGANGSEFFFSGLAHNSTHIKSYEGIDIAWVEEAHLVSKSSWEILIPTIREENSEIWVTFNPELEEDETYQRFVLHPPDDAIVVKLDWRDNPWFPEVLKKEKDELKRKDPDAYLTVWEGQCRQILEGAIFGNELRAAREQGRITNVPYDPTFPVDTYWDLGWADFTSIWFVQPLAMEFRVIDFYQNHLQGIQHYLGEMQARKYVYRKIYLPHDADHAQLAAGGRTIVQQVRSAGFSASVVERIPTKMFGVNAARAVFPMCFFDQAKCHEGLRALALYRFEYDPDTGKYSDKPAHDWASHAADAFQQLGVSIRVAPTQRQIDSIRQKPKWDVWNKLNQTHQRSA